MEIIYEDDDIIVIHKPAGLPTQTSKVGQADCVSELKIQLHEEHPDAGEPYLGVVHRLDQPVEGILVFAKNPRAAAYLSKDVQNDTMKKDYLAVVCSDEDIPAGQIRLVDYMARDNAANISYICDKEDAGARQAVLVYEKINDRMLMGMDGSYRVHLVKIHLVTGRHHQIRLQMSHAGLPVLGDNKYGYMPEGYKGPLCLVAYNLAMRHPSTGRAMEFTIESESLKRINEL